MTAKRQVKNVCFCEADKKLIKPHKNKIASYIHIYKIDYLNRHYKKKKIDYFTSLKKLQFFTFASTFYGKIDFFL